MKSLLMAFLLFLGSSTWADTATVTPTASPTATPTITPTFTPYFQTSSLGPVGRVGLDRHDAKNSAQVEASSIGEADCSAAAQVSVSSSGSAVINPRSVSGLSWAGSSYSAQLIVRVVNSGSASLVAFVRASLTPVSGGHPAGELIPAGSSGQFSISSKAGLAVHLQTLSGSTTAFYSVCTQ